MTLNFEALHQKWAINRVIRHAREVDPAHENLPPGFSTLREVKFIRESFKNPARQSRTLSQIQTLTEMQYDPSKVWGELAGRISRSPDGIKLDPLPSEQDLLVFECLTHFKTTGATDAATVLQGQVMLYHELIRHAEPDYNFEAIINLENELGAHSHKTRPAQFSDTLNFELLENILSSMTAMNLTFLRAFEPDFCGAFHFHPNGTPINAADLRESEKLGVPMLVISTDATSRSVMCVDLAYLGEFETLYRG